MLSHLKNYWKRFTGVEQKLLLVLILVLATSVVILAAQNHSKQTRIPDYGGQYTEGLIGQPQHLNPLLAPTNDIDTDLARIVYAGLYKFDSNLNFTPDLAETLPEVSPNGKQYTLKLKENLFWHDGAPITADDVVYTFESIQNPDLSSPLRFSWNKVDVEKINGREVKLTTREPSSTFIANLTVGILPKHIWGNISGDTFAHSKFNLEPIGAGPFRITEIKRGRQGEVRAVYLKPHEKYHERAPYLKSLTFKFYKSTDELIEAYQGKDVMGLGYVPFDRRLFIEPTEKLQRFLLPLPQYQAVFINRVKNPAPLEDVKIRTALAKSVDKKRIIEQVYGQQSGEAYGPILPGHLGYQEQIPGADMNIYDPHQAEVLLEQAGWAREGVTSGLRKDKQGRTLALTLATNNFSPNVRVAELLKEMWESVGIQLILNIEPIADLEQKYIRPRNFELLLFSENVGADPDPFPFWHSSQLRDPGLNLSTFSNKQADKLLVEARGNIAPQERAIRYRQFQEIFVGDVPAIFITRSAYVYYVSSQVKGLGLEAVVTPADRFADIQKWYIETKRVKK